MKSGLAQSTTNSAKSLAQQVARQMAQEPLEILKNVAAQVTGEEIKSAPENSPRQESPEVQSKLIQNQQEIQDKMKASRRIEAYKRELDDMRKQDLFRDLQAKITEGVEVPLEDYTELSVEQKQVLRAQMEAVKFQKQQAKYNEAQTGFHLPGSKKGRKMGGGQKGAAEKEQTRVEKPVPPSG